MTDSYGFAVNDTLQVTVTNTVAFQETGGQVVMEAEHFAENVGRSDRAWLTQTVVADFVGGSYMSAVPDTDV